MTARWLNWWRSRPLTEVARRTAKLALEQLDDRLNPVIGTVRVPLEVAPGTGLDGVVQILKDGRPFGSGTLLSTGRHVLTAAHVVNSSSSYTVAFELPTGRVERGVSAKAIHPNWMPWDPKLPNDIAVITLNSTAPTAANRYDIYRGTDEIGKPIQVAGYGWGGNGQYGLPENWDDPSRSPLLVKRAGDNRFDTTAQTLNDEIQVLEIKGGPIYNGSFRLSVNGMTTPTIQYPLSKDFHNTFAANVRRGLESVLGAGTVAVRSISYRDPSNSANDSNLVYVRFQGAIAGQNVPTMAVQDQRWSVWPGGTPASAYMYGRVNGGQFAGDTNRLMADFDNGNALNDAFGFLYGITDLGRGDREALTAPGDSGGPAFIAGKVAGVTSGGTSLGRIPDVDWDKDFSFGEVAFYTRVSSYAGWIDRILYPKLWPGLAGAFEGIRVQLPSAWQPEPIPGLVIWPTSLAGATEYITPTALAFAPDDEATVKPAAVDPMWVTDSQPPTAPKWPAFAGPQTGDPVTTRVKPDGGREVDDEAGVDLLATTALVFVGA